VIADVKRDRLETADRDRLIRNTADGDGMGRVKQSLPQDPGAAGKAQVQYLSKQLAGHSLHWTPETGDKVVRATPFASQVNVGNVVMVRGAWNDAWKDEARLFPNGAFDDQVDAAARAFNALQHAQAGVFA
jgi:predicted phage terminase large subunit-like protein